MGKALLGYMVGDSRLHDENQRLRRRVADLEATVLRLQAENDALTARLAPRAKATRVTVPADVTVAAPAASR